MLKCSYYVSCNRNTQLINESRVQEISPVNKVFHGEKSSSRLQYPCSSQKKPKRKKIRRNFFYKVERDFENL